MTLCAVVGFAGLRVIVVCRSAAAASERVSALGDGDAGDEDAVPDGVRLVDGSAEPDGSPVPVPDGSSVPPAEGEGSVTEALGRAEPLGSAAANGVTAAALSSRPSVTSRRKNRRMTRPPALCRRDDPAGSPKMSN